MADKKIFSIGFVIFFVVLTIYLYKNNDAVATTIANDGAKGTFYYFISNPAYILLFLSIFYLNSEARPWRNIVGSLMIIIASDIISYPRLPTTGFEKELAILASSDGIFIKNMISHGFSYQTSFMIYYLVLPIALVVGALAILGIHNFFKLILKKGSS